MSYKEQFDGIWNDKPGQHHVLSPDLSQRDPHHSTTSGKYGPSTAIVEHFLERIAIWGPKEWAKLSAHPLIDPDRIDRTYDNMWGPREMGICQGLHERAEEIYAARCGNLSGDDSHKLLGVCVGLANRQDLSPEDYNFLLAPVRAVDPTIGVPS